MPASGETDRCYSHCTGGRGAEGTGSAGSAADGVAVATGTSLVLDVATNETSVVLTVNVVGRAETAGTTAAEVDPGALEAELRAVVLDWSWVAVEVMLAIELEAGAEMRTGEVVS